MYVFESLRRSHVISPRFTCSLTTPLVATEHSVRKRKEEEHICRYCSFLNNTDAIVQFTMEAEKHDKRITRTQHALRDALLELIVECGYEKLTIQQILDRSRVGRATFYLHYRSKEDLLRTSLGGLREQLIQARYSGSTSRMRFGFSLAFFQHIDGHRKLYRAIVGRESGAIVDRQMRILLADLVGEDLKSPRHRAHVGSAADLAAQYVAGALMAIVTWWLDRNIKLSAEEIDRIFRQMTLPALQTIRGSST
jgi:AcrR family transcriptional regulator